MTKREFLSAMQDKLSCLPKEDIEKSVEYYSEIIDDRMEDGLSEREAVNALGSLEEIVRGILEDTPLPKLVKAKATPKRALKAWEIILLILGSPLWLALLVAAVAVVLAVYIALWSVVVSLYAVVVSCAVTAIAAVGGAVLLSFRGNWIQGMLFVGIGLTSAGLTILSFHGSNLAAKGVVILGKKILLGIKRCLIGKETA